MLLLHLSSVSDKMQTVFLPKQLDHEVTFRGVRDTFGKLGPKLLMYPSLLYISNFSLVKQFSTSVQKQSFIKSSFIGGCVEYIGRRELFNSFI